MKHKFEEYFQLPWSVEFQDTAAFIKSVNMPKQDSIFVDTNIDAHVGAVCYAVACANLMPKIAHDLKLFFDRRAYNRSPVSEVDLKRLYNRIAELVGTAQIEETELPD